MKALPYPQIDNIALWDKIVSRKHQPAKGKLLPYRDKVNSRYTFYEEHFNSLDAILPLAFTEWFDVKDELKSCYGDNKEFKVIRQQLFNDLSLSGQTKCPYCLLNRPNTLEHYFDKDDYPEFSVYIPNLVPCCSECNTAKSTLMFDNHGKRKFIHFYHDSIPEEQFLFVRFAYSDTDAIPEASITLRPGAENYFSDLVQKHFSNLSLLSKYKSAILDRLAPIIEEIKIHHQSGTPPKSIKDALEIKKGTLANHYGNNYWETCIYEGILNSPNFLNQLLSV